MPRLDSSDLFKLLLVAFISGAISGAVFMLLQFLCSLIGKGKGKIMRFILKHIPVFVCDMLFSVAFTVWNVLMFSAYGGGSVRISAILFEFAGWAVVSKLIKTIIQIIKDKRRKASTQKETVLSQ